MNMMFNNQNNDYENDPLLQLEHIKLDLPEGTTVSPPFHPHVGHESISYIIEGAAEYKDTFHNHGYLKKGDLNWISCASGIWHVEYPSSIIQEKGGKIEMIQIWMRSPNSVADMAPTYQDIKFDLLPVYKQDSYQIKILCGYYEVKEIGDGMGERVSTQNVLVSPVKSETDILILDVELEEKEKINLLIEEKYEVYIYLYKGNYAFFGPEQIRAEVSDCVKFENMKRADSSYLTVLGSNKGKVNFLLIGVTKLNDPFVKKNSFVAKNEADLKELFRLYEIKKIAKIKPIILESIKYATKEEMAEPRN
eukprot:TRINITY_DN581_c0_g1_i1.p1 TRINITY_DN581_c0_g1~~TRINITY_DN581_c0_g1_i1.p1  ORF type:complete len:351 (-),score=88.07 TRINITY_DN581_c0_g1_i1:34-954(-)